MSFLTPFYIAGLLAVTVPIVFHLIRRTPHSKQPFSTLRFLKPSPPKITKRSRLDHWPLLLLRAAIVCLLAMAFARPFLRETIQQAKPQTIGMQTVILLDTSASMQREDLWKQAVEKTIERVEAATETDQLTIFTFDKTTRPLLSFTEWQNLKPAARTKIIREKLQNLKPGWAATQTGEALIQSAETLEHQATAQPGARGQKLLLISDLQTGSQLSALQSYPWPKQIPVEIHTVKTKVRTNAGLQLVGKSSTAIVKQTKVRVSNAANSQSEQFELRWKGSNESVSVYVPPGSSRVISAPERDGDASQLVLTGDEHTFDNTLFVEPYERTRFNVLSLETAKSDSLHRVNSVLKGAFPTTANRRVDITSQETAQPLFAPALSDVQLIISHSDLSPEQRVSLKGYIRSGGGTMLLVLGENAHEETVRDLTGISCQIENVKPTEFTLLTHLDFTHPAPGSVF